MPMKTDQVRESCLSDYQGFSDSNDDVAILGSSGDRWAFLVDDEDLVSSS
jgi:hypothetical protein